MTGPAAWDTLGLLAGTFSSGLCRALSGEVGEGAQKLSRLLPTCPASHPPAVSASVQLPSTTAFMPAGLGGARALSCLNSFSKRSGDHSWRNPGRGWEP